MTSTLGFNCTNWYALRSTLILPTEANFLWTSPQTVVSLRFR